MTGSSDAALVAALEAVAQAVQHQSKVESGSDGTRMLETFLRNHPPTFKGRYDPHGCSETQKVRFGTHMLAEEADDLWVSLLPVLEQDDAVVTWAMFRKEFLSRYFPEDVRGKKEIDMFVTEYAVKFVELAKFYPYYSAVTAEFFSRTTEFWEKNQEKSQVGRIRFCRALFIDLRKVVDNFVIFPMDLVWRENDLWFRSYDENTPRRS
ncbi:hypothetical protein MTR_3g448540 [Medicago truncatula]|uniref:Retrotransposon gag domain-containing protein n=1 Tax=Medicago truncatula TaxID=3880 RepID=A0A072UVZ7_MEDTR|nr:hypothetical protein MTR_3g448540 [Medicago truncatula]